MQISQYLKLTVLAAKRGFRPFHVFVLFYTCLGLLSILFRALA